MPSKLQVYRQMAEEAAKQLTGSYQGWTAFLTTAARLYKYPYNEQVMIHAQRPDATACAEYDVWNKTMSRYVRRGSKGIALIDTRGDYPKLRYVFDVSDTGSLEHSRAVRLWQLRPEYTESVSAMLERTYDVPGTNGLREQLEAVAAQLAGEYWNEHQRDFGYILADSFLEEYDEFNIGVQFRTAATVSITYALMSRCGLEPETYFEHEDFLSIFDFNTPATVAALGTAVSEINQQVLRQIETTIRNVEREQRRQIEAAERTETNDRNDLHPERGLPDSRPYPEPAAAEAPGQVRQNAQTVFAGTQADPVEPDGTGGNPVPASLGDRRNSESTPGADDAGNGGEKRSDREAEGSRPHKMGGTDEQPESPSRGNSAERADLRLTDQFPEEKPDFDVPVGTVVQLSLFPTENEQIVSIQQAESVQPALFAFSMSIPQEDIDHILRCGGNSDDARMEIATEFSKGKTDDDVAAFLERTFHGGNGIVTENGRYAAWYAEDGIHIATGDSARYLNAAKIVSWTEAAGRIRELLENGTFATNVELAEAPGHERLRLAGALWNLRHDFSEAAVEQGYLPSMADFRGNGFPEETAALADALNDPAKQQTLIAEYAHFYDAYKQNPELMRFHYHRFEELRRGLSELTLPRREFETDMTALPEVRHFITEDEIAASLSRGSGIEGGKGRIYTYFSEKHTLTEQADFLKNEYGFGGHSHAVSGATHSSEEHSGKGIALKKADCPEVQMNWTNVAKRISELIRRERFLTPDEKAQYEALQQRNAARNNFIHEYNSIKEAHPEDIVLFQVGDFFEMYGEDAKAAADLLDLHLTTRNIPDIGRVNMCGIPAHRLEQYVEKLRDSYCVTIAAVQAPGQEHTSYSMAKHDTAEEIPLEADSVSETGVNPPAAEPETEPTVQELLEQYKPVVITAVTEDMLYRNACGHSDKENSEIECNAAVRRAVLASDDMQLIKLFSDVPEFRECLHREIFDETYPQLHELIRPLSQDDIDDAIRRWNGDMDSKRRVVRYMETHAREKDTAARLSREYSGSDGKSLFVVRSGSPETVELPWPKVQRRIAQLIQNDQFYTEEEQDRFEDIDAASIREQLEQRGDSPSPFVEQVMADVERIATQEQTEPAYITETVADYPAEENHLPFDVVVQTIRTNEPDIEPPAPGSSPVSIPINGEWTEFPSVAEAEKAAYEEHKAQTKANAQNFRITDEHLGEGGSKAKYQANINAIRLLKHLEAEGMQASSEQQEILSRYVGWGGLADAFDPSKENWRKEYAELKELLTPEEYEAARASTLNAHYTSPTVINAIYEAVGNMGFQTGNILEPSMGVGNFFGLLPKEMQNSRLYGVELDSITGRIAKQLYPKADITVAGFETTDRKDFYDLAIGNVPFGQYQVNDRAYNKLGFSIHDYFFAKSLDQVRPGGVIAFVTSRYTMDKQSPEVRRYIAQRAELLGAIRLPNNAFKANAGTEVVSDIIFLQKRDSPIEIEPEWVHLGQNEDGFAINSYFIDNPQMVLGRQTSESTQYGKQDFTVAPIEGRELADQLHDAIQNIRGTYQEAELPELGEGEKIDTSIPADPNVKNYSYTVVDGEVYYRENSRMVRPELNATAKERIKGMVELRDCVQQLISQQMDGFVSDEAIRQTQHELNERYDSFTAKYGLINSRGNALAFADDSSYYLLCSLEVLDEENNLKRKADMFTKRTIKPHEIVTSVDTAAEALALSISEKAGVDLSYMSQLSGKDEETLVSELAGVIFFDPVERNWQTADEYLSGDVREKLRIAQSYALPGFPKNGLADYKMNVAALEQAQPKDLDASEIEVRLGATWIDPEYIRQFMFELLEPPFYQRRSIDVHYSEFTAEWSISGKNSVSYGNINAYMTYGTDRANAYKILEDTLNLRDVRIYDTKTDADGRERRVLNSKETTLAQQKQQAIKEAFQDWIWKDPDRRQALVQKYNELFNSTRPREYDGSHITFSGMNPEIQLREHQQNAVAHILYCGNTLLAHEVGAGKTFEMVAAAMESKRLGLCQKPMFVVPNHLTEQWASEFLRLYPSANILVATRKDFEARNRKKFCGRIATGDYDAVIIGHSQFEKIPVSMERQERLLQEQISEVEEGLAELRASRAERFTVKSLERTKKGLETKLKKLQDSGRKDDVVTFEQLGVDRLYVDEAHSFKNLFLYTKMRNVAGLSTSDAQKSSDMLLKCRYIDEITGGRGVVFATGTPVSNSMTELYTMMRYLQHDTLKDKHLAHFDCWASTFGETTTAIELAPEGTGYRARTRFSKFFNLPELMTLFKEAADIKTADQLHLPTPTPIYHNVVAQPTEIQKAMVQELSERAAAVHSGKIDPSVDNMLRITSDGRKLGLDQRVINPNLPDDPASKVNMCVDNIYQIWDEGQADKLTQLVFCDLSTPKTTSAPKAAKAAAGNLDSPELHALENLADQSGAEEAPFTIYDDIREKLTARGIPREQIAFIHEANTEVRKKELFAKVRSGQVRVLIGSTFKMGAGMNVQDRLVALHDLDCPWRPGDLEQRSGRIIRQGNTNPEVHIYRYVTESTFDAYLWQTVENKQKFISQIMTSKSPVRSCEDIDETALSYAEIKALCAGDERIKEKMDLDVDVARLKLMRASHQSQQFRLEDNLLKTFPAEIEKHKGFAAGFEADLQTLSQHPHPKDGFAGMVVKSDQLTDKDNAGAALLEALKEVKGMAPVPIGSYRGFQMSLTLEDFGREYVLTLKGEMSHRVSLGKDARGNLTRIDNALAAMPERLQTVQDKLESLYAQVEKAKAEIGKPFPQEEELRQKSARLAVLNAELNIDDKMPMERLAGDTAITAKSSRPSVLAKLKSAPPPQPTAEKPRHREQDAR